MKTTYQDKKCIRILLKSFDGLALDLATKKIVKIIQSTGSVLKGPIPIPSEHKLIVLNRSPHVHKKAQDHFATTIHKRLLDIYYTSNATIDSLTKLEVSAAVGIKINLH